MSAENPDNVTKEPTRLGGFEILEKIGEGGMGTVYRARQISLDRVVALKVLSAQLAADAKYTDSFLREARSAARLSHPNIIPVHDAGEADGHYYYAMELVSGKTLYQWVRRDGALREKTALEIGICVASALKHAWDKERLIHRDVKPENVMVDSDGNVKLCDLGLAKNFGESTTLSLTGQVFGTPQYMSPEQARGDRAVDFRTDIYSLGATLYFALTGEIPFQAGTPTLVMARHLTEQLPDPRQFNSEVSPNTVRVLEKMLAKDPADRYQNWDEVLRDLELVRQHKPPVCQPLAPGKSTLGCSAPAPSLLSTQPTDAAATRLRRPATMVLIAGVAILALSLGVGLTLLLTRARPQPPPVSDTGEQVVALPPPGAPPRPQPRAQPVTATEAENRLAQILQFAEANPSAEKEVGQRLRKLISDFPDSPQAVEARRKLLETEERQRQAEAERKRQEEEVRRQAEQATRAQEAQVQAELAFNDFRKPFLETLLKRDYAGAQSMAQRMAANPAIGPLKDEVGACEAAAARLKKVWDDLPVNALRLRGRKLVAQGISGTLSGVGDGELIIEVREGVTMGVPIAKLNTVEVLALAAASTPVVNADTALDGIWFMFAEGRVADANALLTQAQRMRVETEPTRRLMAMLTQGPMEEGAQKSLARLRTLVESGQRTAARSELQFLKSRYANTKAFYAAAAELAELEAAVNAREAESVGSGGQAGVFPKTFAGHTATVTSVMFTPDGRYLVSASEDKTMRLWETATARSLRVYRVGDDWVKAVAVTPDGRYGLTADGGGAIKVWDLQQHGNVRSFDQGATYIHCLAISPDGKQALTGHGDGKVRLWDVLSGKVIRVIAGHTRGVRGVAFGPGGLTAVSASEDQLVKLWHLTTGKEVRAFKSSNGGVRAVAFSRDGKFVAAGCVDATVRLWDASTGNEVRRLQHHSGGVNSVAFSPDGRFILSGSSDRSVKLWEIATGKVLKTFTGHTGEVTSVAFSPDGRYAVSSSADKTLKLWELPGDERAGSSRAAFPPAPAPPSPPLTWGVSRPSPALGKDVDRPSVPTLDMLATFGVEPQHGGKGIEVLAVRPSSRADRVGLKPKDVITHINGVKMTSLEQVRVYLNQTVTAQPVPLQVTCHGNSPTLTVPD